jgi:HEAT repeat protein
VKSFSCTRLAAILGAVLLGTYPASARAYITAPVQTLGQLCDSTYITLVRVEKLSKEKGIIIYRKVRDIKGKYPLDQIRHAFDLKNTPQHKGEGDVPVRPDEKDWQYSLQWAAVGKTAVIFSLKYDPYGDFGHTYIDKCWYATMCPKRDWDFWWSIYSDPALLTRWHCGTPAHLATAVEQILAGKTSVVPTLAGGSREDLRQGRGKIQGLRVGPELLDYNPDRDRVTDWLYRDLLDMIKDLGNLDRQIRLQALKDLALAGFEGKTAAGKVAPLIQEADEEMRLAALTALGRIDPENAKIVPGVSPFLKHADPERRIQAAEILTQTSARAKTAGSMLTALIQEPDVSHRLRILELLSKAGAVSSDVSVAAVALMENPEEEVRLRTSAVLARLGPAAKPALPALIKALKDSNREVRIQAADTLGLIGPEAKSAVSALADAVRTDSSGTVRIRSAEALGLLGPAAKAARSALEAALRDPTMAERTEVLEKIRELQAKLK